MELYKGKSKEFDAAFDELLKYPAFKNLENIIEKVDSDKQEQMGSMLAGHVKPFKHVVNTLDKMFKTFKEKDYGDETNEMLKTLRSMMPLLIKIFNCYKS